MEQLDLFGAPIQKKEEKRQMLKKPAIITIDEPEEVQQNDPEQPVDIVADNEIGQDLIIEQQPDIVEPIELSVEENIIEQRPEATEPQASITELSTITEETDLTEQELQSLEDENEITIEEDEKQALDAKTLNDETDLVEQEIKGFEVENVNETSVVEEEQNFDSERVNEENDFTEPELNEFDVENEEPILENETEVDNEVLNEEDDLAEQEIKGFEDENEIEIPITEDEEENFFIEASNKEEDITEEEIIDEVDELKKENKASIEDEITEETELQKPGPVKTPAYKLSPEKTPSKRGRKSLKEINLDVALLDIPEDEELYKKNYYSITEVAEWFRVNPSLLRFWENEFDILKPRKNRKGDRLFRPEDIKNLRIIYYLLRQQKYSIEGAKQFLKDNKNKAEMQTQLVESLTKFRGFLLELRANLGA